ncbi:MAG: HAD family phosphatase [Pseudomonadota bacterium]
MKNVVFDVGQVLLYWDPRQMWADDFDSMAEVEGFLEEIGFMDWHKEQDRGRTFVEAVADHGARFPHHAEKLGKYDTHWDRSIDHVIEGSVAILRALEVVNTPLYGITNYPAEKFTIARQQYDFLNLMTDVVVSGEEKLIKPDPAIYRCLLDRNGLVAGETIFIDDSPKNIDAANALGIDGILFTGPEDLGHALRTRGLPV